MSEISSCEEDGGNDGECRGEGGWWVIFDCVMNLIDETIEISM